MAAPRKAAPRRTGTRKDAPRDSAPRDSDMGENGARDSGAGRGAAGLAGLSAVRAAEEAVAQIRLLTGREPEAVVGVERAGDGWAVTVELVETHRIPDSADILACYRVELAPDGDLAGYRRTQRYARGHVDGRHRT
ncbi:gas vesicle protein GvpO [Actinomadura oligospora]|uniref:gas vesicle protein GvpO n=1 Tax=Actinomadura oligospora TaxID=111804 RepID=UPI0004B27AFC|nr:gas vesicle protein GvpO [Actinomadura oligospora]